MKFLYGYFHPDTGQSIVALANKNGTYIGQAKVHPEDKLHASKFAGCRLAEARAWLNYLIKEVRRKKLMLRAIQNLNKDIHKHCENIDPKIQHRINLKIRDYNKEITELKANITLLNEQIDKDIKTRDDIIHRSKVNKKSN